jgi:hypothetical protein
MESDIKKEAVINLQPLLKQIEPTVLLRFHF